MTKNLPGGCLNPDHRVLINLGTNHSPQPDGQEKDGQVLLSKTTAPQPAKAGSPSAGERGYPEVGGAWISNERGGDGDFPIKALPSMFSVPRTHRRLLNQVARSP